MRLATALCALAALALAGCGTGAKHTPWPGSAATHPGHGPSHLAVAADTHAFALNLLIAEHDDRLIAISPRGQVVWRVHQDDPTQVFVSPTGRTLVIAEARRGLVVLRRVDNRQVSDRFGRDALGRAGGGLGRPESAFELPSGDLAVADGGRCLVMLVAPGARVAARVLGTSGVCRHDPPRSFAQPDGAFPAPRGGLVVTEHDPAWIDVLSAAGRLVHAFALRGLRDASDATAYGRSGLVVAGATDPGVVEELDGETGVVRWRYGPAAGRGRLDDPAEAMVLAGGDVLVVDSGGDRVIVIDPKSDRIVWQYGHTEAAGRTPGYLDDPGSATLVPIGP